MQTPICIFGQQIQTMENNRPIKILEHIRELQQEFYHITGIQLAGVDQPPFQPAPIKEQEMTRLEVLKYLGISNRTYIRRVNDGTLIPRKMPGGDRFYKRDLDEARKESIRRGRV